MTIVKGMRVIMTYFSVIPQFLYGIMKEYNKISVCILHSYKLDGWDANLNMGTNFFLLMPTSVWGPSNLLTETFFFFFRDEVVGV